MTATSTMAPAHHEPALLGQTVVVIGGSAGIGLTPTAGMRPLRTLAPRQPITGAF